MHPSNVKENAVTASRVLPCCSPYKAAATVDSVYLKKKKKIKILASEWEKLVLEEECGPSSSSAAEHRPPAASGASPHPSWEKHLGVVRVSVFLTGHSCVGPRAQGEPSAPELAVVLLPFLAAGFPRDL